MNISPATLKRWRDQLHLLAPPDAAKMREQEKTIEHMARVVAELGIKAITIDPGCPWQNGVIESFNSRFRKEFSDRWYFHNYDDIQVAMDDWLLDYNRYRPHGSLGLMTPDEFAGKPVDRRAHLLTLVAG